jgi:hypothetical protein
MDTTADDIGLQEVIVVSAASSIRSPLLRWPVRSSFRATRVNRATVSSPQSLQIGRPSTHWPSRASSHDVQHHVGSTDVVVDHFRVQKQGRGEVPSNDKSQRHYKPARHSRGASTHPSCVREIIRTWGRRQNSVSDTSSGALVTSCTAP